MILRPLAGLFPLLRLHLPHGHLMMNRILARMPTSPVQLPLYTISVLAIRYCSLGLGFLIIAFPCELFSVLILHRSYTVYNKKSDLLDRMRERGNSNKAPPTLGENFRYTPFLVQKEDKNHLETSSLFFLLQFLLDAIHQTIQN